MKFALRLSHQILLLVLMPILVELFYIAILYSSFEQFENEFQKEVRGRRFVSNINDLNTCINKGADAVERFVHTQDSDEITNYHKYLTKGGQLLTSLTNSLTSENRGYVSRLDRLKKAIEKANTATQDLLKVVESGEGQRIYWGFLAKRAADGVVTELNLISKEEQQELNARIKTLEYTRKNLQNLLVIGIALNLTMAFFATWLVVSRITRRIQILVESSRSIATSSDLPPKLTGNDELTELDSSLRKMAKALDEMLRKQRATFEKSTAVICSLDKSLCFTVLNEACLSTWGYSQEELLGRRLSSVIQPDDREATINAIHRALNEDAVSFENQVKAKDGGVIDTSWSIRWVTSEKAYFAIAQDISAVKQLERIKREFVSIVSHDLRSPLTALSIKLQILSRGGRGELPAKALDELATAQANIKQLISLTKDLLDLERLEVGRWQMNFAMRSLYEIIDEAVQSIQDIADLRNIEIVMPDTDVSIEADGARLSQVVINILSNSLKYAPEGRPINVVISEIENGTWVELQINDSGPGIPLDAQGIIFERFKQADQHNSKIPGYGLGLSICGQIISSHQGTLGLNSEPGKGCTFWFRLPKKQPTSLS